MNKLRIGETVFLEDNTEYAVVTTIKKDNYEYAYLITSEKPYKIKFAKELLSSGKLELEIVSNKEEKAELLALFEKSL